LRKATQQFTCEDLDFHLSGGCDAEPHGSVRVDGLIYQCPRCGEAFFAKDSHCLESKHRRCRERLRGYKGRR
jgi:hypothetical protein